MSFNLKSGSFHKPGSPKDTQTPCWLRPWPEVRSVSLRGEWNISCSHVWLRSLWPQLSINTDYGYMCNWLDSTSGRFLSVWLIATLRHVWPIRIVIIKKCPKLPGIYGIRCYDTVDAWGDQTCFRYKIAYIIWELCEIELMYITTFSLFCKYKYSNIT